MAIRGTYEAVKQAIQDLIAPELERIKGQIGALDARVGAVESGLNAKIDALDSKIDEVESRLDGKIEALDFKMSAMESRLDSKIDALDFKMTAMESKLDGKIEVLDSKITTAESRLDGKITTVDAKLEAVHLEIRVLEKRIEDGFDYTRKRVEDALNVRERLAALEAAMRALQHP